MDLLHDRPRNRAYRFFICMSLARSGVLQPQSRSSLWNTYRASDDYVPDDFFVARRVSRVLCKGNGDHEPFMSLVRNILTS